MTEETKTPLEGGGVMSSIVIKGSGFRPQGGGFAAIIVNGKSYEPEEIAEALEAAATSQARQRELEEALRPLGEVGAELVSCEAGDEWKIEIPDDRIIFSFCGKGVTAGNLRKAFAALFKQPEGCAAPTSEPHHAPHEP